MIFVYVLYHWGIVYITFVLNQIASIDSLLWLKRHHWDWTYLLLVLVFISIIFCLSLETIIVEGFTVRKGLLFFATQATALFRKASSLRFNLLLILVFISLISVSYWKQSLLKGSRWKNDFYFLQLKQQPEVLTLIPSSAARWHLRFSMRALSADFDRWVLGKPQYPGPYLKLLTMIQISIRVFKQDTKLVVLYKTFCHWFCLLSQILNKSTAITKES